MKKIIVSIFLISAIGIGSAPAISDDGAAPKGPPKTMGDQGKLPASETMRGAVPDMTGTDPGASSAGGSPGAGGSALRMGDEAGKLPATGTVSGAVPEMRGAAPDEQ